MRERRRSSRHKVGKVCLRTKTEWEWWNIRKEKTSSNVCSLSCFFFFPLHHYHCGVFCFPSLLATLPLPFPCPLFYLFLFHGRVFFKACFPFSSLAPFSLSCYRPLRLLSHSLFRFLTDWLSFIETVTGSIMEFIWMTVRRHVRVIFVPSQEQCVCVCVHTSLNCKI